MKLFLILTAAIIVHSATSYNILGIFPYNGKSHFLVYRVYLRELAARGHNVTVISPFPEKNPPTNYHDISLSDKISVFTNKISLQSSFKTNIDLASSVITAANKNCEVMLENERVQKIVKDKQKFDVIVFEQFNSDCALGLAYKVDAPYIAITSFQLMMWHFERFGLTFDPWDLADFHDLPRIYGNVMYFLGNLYYRYVMQRNDQNTLAKYYDDIPPLETLARDIKCLLLYQHFVLSGPFYLPPNVIEVGGYHVAKALPLTGELKKFVDEAEHGVVFISFGSVIKASTMSEEKLKVILDTIDEFPQRFIWKWEDKTIQTNASKLYVSDWLPQIDILGNPKTVAFFTHAGQGSATEGMYYGVPMVAMPITADQPTNALHIERSGIGIQVQLNDLNKENLVAALKKVLEPEFRQQVKEVSSAWHDRPTNNLDTAIFWTEFVARHPKLNFGPLLKPPFYLSYTLGDLAIISILLLVTYFVVKITFCRQRKPIDKKLKNQ